MQRSEEKSVQRTQRWYDIILRTSQSADRFFNATLVNPLGIERRFEFLKYFDIFSILPINTKKYFDIFHP
jgi:hypothetical protein